MSNAAAIDGINKFDGESSSFRSARAVGEGAGEEIKNQPSGQLFIYDFVNMYFLSLSVCTEI